MLYHLRASLDGLTTVRAFGLERRLRNEFDFHQDSHTTTRYLVQATARMFAMWLEAICVLLLILLITSFILADPTHLLGGNVGLALTQMLGMMGLIQWAVRQSSDLESSMTSVERILDYCFVEGEANGNSRITPSPLWPERGGVIFENVSLSYGITKVLGPLDLAIKGGQKLAIAGRTGAGKTTLIHALLRLYDSKGVLKLDGIDISNLDVRLLRSRVAVVSQRPLILPGTVRENLDPLSKHSDIDLRKVLDLVHLSLADLGLDLEKNQLSSGERQLLCLARAILQDTRILILDEATSSLDPNTERFIYETIYRLFRKATVIFITHRLRSLLPYCDRLFFIEGGVINELDIEEYRNEKDGEITVMDL